MKKEPIDTFDVDCSEGTYRVEIFNFEYHPPQSISPEKSDSDIDYYGWTEIDYAIVDPNTDKPIPTTAFCQKEIDYIEGRIAALFLG